MNAGSAPAKSRPLFPMAEEQAQMLEAGLSEFQELYSGAMDRALGMQQASLAAAARMQSDVINSYNDSCRNTVSLTPKLVGWFGTLAQAFASIMEWQLSLLSLFAPLGWAAGSSASPAALPADELEHAIDVGFGQSKKRRAGR